MEMSEGVGKDRECEASGQAGIRLARILDFH